MTGFKAGTGRRMQIAAVAVAMVLVAGFAFVETRQLHADGELAAAAKEIGTTPPPVDVTTVAAPPSSSALQLPGQTAAWFQSTIYARVSGYVAKWLVDIGDKVREGQVLAIIDTPELDAQLVASQAKLRAAQSEVEVSESQAEFSRTTYDRWKSAPKGVVSEQEREDKKAGFESAQAALAAAKAQVNLVQADVDRLTAFEKFKQVTAPFDGTIVERRVDIGDLVTAGSSSGTTPLYRMAKDDPIRVFVDAPQAVVAEMKDGTPARVTASVLGSRIVSGRITRTADAVDPVARTLRVEVDLPNANARLVPGEYVQVGFDIPVDGLSRVPAAALVFRSSGPQVAIVGDDSRIRFSKVTIARDDGSTVDIGSGVKPGDRVVLNLSSQIADGEKVRVSGSESRLASASSPAG